MMSRKICVLAMLFSLGMAVLHGEDKNKMIEVGSKAPDFELPGATEGKKYSLKSQLEKGPVVLVVYRSGDW